jgi:hypothetical protein
MTNRPNQPFDVILSEARNIVFRYQWIKSARNEILGRSPLTFPGLSARTGLQGSRRTLLRMTSRLMWLVETQRCCVSYCQP